MNSVGSAVLALLLGFTFALTFIPHVEPFAVEPVIENQTCRIQFDERTGGLRRIANRQTGDEYLKNGDPHSMPFRLYLDVTKEFEIKTNDIFQLVFDAPQDICGTVLQPGTCQFVDIKHRNGLVLRYRGEGLELKLTVDLDEEAGVSDWSLRVTNIGGTARDFLVNFPCLDGVRLGPDPTGNLATAMNQGGVTVPAWERHGGVLGESNQLSMQWHAIWDPKSHNALGVIFMDPEVRPKRLELTEPTINLHYFPPIELEPGKSIDLPPVRMLIYQGDWRPAARAYQAWHKSAFAGLEPPEWYRRSNGSVGRHFKKGGPGIAADYGGQVVLDSFRDLPAMHIRCPIDFPEYAFFCRSSIDHPCHTDGDNIVRDDMGGAEALREGIEGVHRLGLHTQLYVEGYIVYRESELARSGKAERWAVMHKDGTLTGPYSKQGFFHLCPGCVEWQDHLAETVGRLLRETGADGIRLDSLGFYYLPCYNPAHKHKNPFGYNEWIKQLLAKVHKSAVSANPNVLLTTEGSADWFSPWVHGALTSRRSRDLPYMRLAMGPYRPYVYATGSLWASLSGFPGGGCGGLDIETLDANWLCARFPVHEALVWGDVTDIDPQSTEREYVTRQFCGDGYWAVVAARPASQESIWPAGQELSEKRTGTTLIFPGLAPRVEEVLLCDIERLNWQPAEFHRWGDDLQLPLQTNWALAILRSPRGPVVAGFDSLPPVQPGATLTVPIKILSTGKYRGHATVDAPGLIVKPDKIALPGQVEIQVPPDAFPGYYAVTVSGKNLLGLKRFLVVSKESL